MFFFHFFVDFMFKKCRLQAFAKSRDGDIGRWAEHTFAGGVATGAAFLQPLGGVNGAAVGNGGVVKGRCFWQEIEISDDFSHYFIYST